MLEPTATPMCMWWSRIIGRLAMISVKYGFFSAEEYSAFRSCRDSSIAKSALQVPYCLPAPWIFGTLHARSRICVCKYYPAVGAGLTTLGPQGAQLSSAWCLPSEVCARPMYRQRLALEDLQH